MVPCYKTRGKNDNEVCKNATFDEITSDDISILILATITSIGNCLFIHGGMIKRHLSHFHPFPTSVALCSSPPLHNHHTQLSTNNQDTTQTNTLKYAPFHFLFSAPTENKSCLFQPKVSALHLLIPTIRFFFAQIVSLVLLTHLTNPSA